MTKQRSIIDEVHRICEVMGPTAYDGDHLIVRSSLSRHELPSLWLAIATDLILNGCIRSLDEFPAVSCGEALAIGIQSNIRLLPEHPSFDVRAAAPSIGNNPIVILAGRSGTGKSTILHQLAKRYRIPNTITQTSRPRRQLDLDFATVRYAATEGQYNFRDASLSLPVAFRRNTYIFPLADSLLARFDSTLDLVVLIDSHPLRVNWRKHLVPATLVIWLDTKEEERLQRVASRGSDIEFETPESWAALDQVRANADLVIDTSTTSLASSVNLIADLARQSRR